LSGTLKRSALEHGSLLIHQYIQDRFIGHRWVTLKEPDKSGNYKSETQSCFLLFRILVIGIYLGFGAWGLESERKAFAFRSYSGGWIRTSDLRRIAMGRGDGLGLWTSV
jgi:hypothetical protein